MRNILVGVVLGVALQSGTTPANEVKRVAGVDAGSGIGYALISVDGRLVGTDGVSGAAPPRLTAQCTKTPAGKVGFELLADFGGVESISYIAPWKSTPNELFPPRVATASVTMEFLGYTNVKPVKRQWNALPEVPGEWKYATPGLDSKNLEQVMFYLQYLRALPTLRLTLPGKATAEWDTAKWQAAVKAEPLCGASGL
jgi:hypothetical protein